MKVETWYSENGIMKANNYYRLKVSNLESIFVESENSDNKVMMERLFIKK